MLKYLLFAATLLILSACNVEFQKETRNLSVTSPEMCHTECQKIGMTLARYSNTNPPQCMCVKN